MEKPNEALANYELERSARHDGAAENAARYEWILENPVKAQHLLYLLASSRKQKADFNAMIDRIIVSEAGAI